MEIRPHCTLARLSPSVLLPLTLADEEDQTRIGAHGMRGSIYEGGHGVAPASTRVNEVLLCYVATVRC